MIGQQLLWRARGTMVRRIRDSHWWWFGINNSITRRLVQLVALGVTGLVSDQQGMSETRLKLERRGPAVRDCRTGFMFLLFLFSFVPQTSISTVVLSERTSRRASAILDFVSFILNSFVEGTPLFCRMFSYFHSVKT